MEKQTRRYITNLPDWELPRLDDQLYDLVDEIAANASVKYFNRETLGDKFFELFRDRICEISQLGSNEALQYFLMGLADGNNGRFPALCVELPFLERGEQIDPLSIAYCVDDEDGSRMELLRVPLVEVIERVLGENDASEELLVRRRVVAASLRKLARRLEAPPDSNFKAAPILR